MLLFIIIDKTFVLFQSPEFDLDGINLADPVMDLSSNGHAPHVPFDGDNTDNQWSTKWTIYVSYLFQKLYHIYLEISSLQTYHAYQWIKKDKLNYVW